MVALSIHDSRFAQNLENAIVWGSAGGVPELCKKLRGVQQLVRALEDRLLMLCRLFSMPQGSLTHGQDSEGTLRLPTASPRVTVDKTLVRWVFNVFISPIMSGRNELLSRTFTDSARELSGGRIGFLLLLLDWWVHWKLVSAHTT